MFFSSIFFYHFHPKCRFFIQVCNFSSKSGECLKGMKTLMAIFFQNFANIVIDSHFLGKKIAIWRQIAYRKGCSVHETREQELD
jgi:hypothetical protein